MTGRYHFRTGAHDTYIGRSNMNPQETTIAEVFADAGYRTGIFGKWHLGENYPMRAIDQGFQKAVVHGGGGIGQFRRLPSEQLLGSDATVQRPVQESQRILHRCFH